MRHVAGCALVGAVIDEQPGVHRFERNRLALAGIDNRRRPAAARTRHRVQVDVVRVQAGRVVVQRQADRVTLAHAQEGAGDRAVEGPVVEGNAIGHLADHFPGGHFDLDHAVF